MIALNEKSDFWKFYEKERFLEHMVYGNYWIFDLKKLICRVIFGTVQRKGLDEDILLNISLLMIKCKNRVW